MKRSFVSLWLLAAVLLVGRTVLSQCLIGEFKDDPIKAYEIKKPFDDPTPIYTKTNFGTIFLRDEFVHKYRCDPEEARRLWSEVVGFKAPDVVGKIAPEIKPGKYTLPDKKTFPFEQLMPPFFLDAFNQPGGQGVNLAMNYTEFEVVPTHQFYYHPKYAQDTLKNMGTAKLDDQGYADRETLKPGMPFPRPSGPQKAWQVLYNWYLDYPWYPENYGWCGTSEVGGLYGINSNYKRDYFSSMNYLAMRLARRSVIEPTGQFYDEKAEKQGERFAYYMFNLTPRDIYGNAYILIKYDNYRTPDNFLYYYSLTRRIRKMSGSDTQDQMVGQDYAYDDVNYLMQPLRPDVYPYECRILEEREMLVPSYTTTGAPWIDTKNGYLYRELQFERRPVIVLEMKQLDPSYIYSKRIFYIDAELMMPFLEVMYNQKGKLYRAFWSHAGFIEPFGWFYDYQYNIYDFIDVHTTLEPGWGVNAIDSPDRETFSLKKLMRGVK